MSGLPDLETPRLQLKQVEDVALLRQIFTDPYVIEFLFDGKAVGDEILAEMIEEKPTAFFRLERPVGKFESL